MKTIRERAAEYDAKIVGECLKQMNGEKVAMATMDEQKPVDKVEPKFKVGDWVVSSVYGTAHIIGINNSNEYQLEYIDGKQEFSSIDYVNYEYDEWTIQDAKGGDILFQDLMDGKTFIYNGVNSDNAILYSFIISNDGKDVLPYHIGKPNTGIGNIEENKNIIRPATKEQRETLFQKMQDAGYEWDEEKKEFKLLITNGGDFDTKNREQNPAWGYEDENIERETGSDLMMVSEKHEGWVNIYKVNDRHGDLDSFALYQMQQGIFETEDEALKVVKKSIGYSTYIATVKIEWEE